MKKYVWILLSVLLVVVVWGLIGSNVISDVGFTCDFGIDSDGSVFCWKWHKNIVGEIGDVFSGFGN